MHELLGSILLVWKGTPISDFAKNKSIHRYKNPTLPILKKYFGNFSLPLGDVENCVRTLRTVSFNSSSSSSTSLTTDRVLRLLRELMDPNFIEHDTYFIFERAMEHMWDW